MGTDEETGKSEFGAGLIVCLVKFSEHLHNDMAQRVFSMIRWMKMSDAEKGTREAEARQFPAGDAAQFTARVKSGFFMSDQQSEEDQLSRAIELWLNGASDHFYDLEREHAPAPLVALADMTLKIGHGFTGEKWTADTMMEIDRLWQEATLALDEKLARLVGAVSEKGYKVEWGHW